MRGLRGARLRENLNSPNSVDPSALHARLKGVLDYAKAHSCPTSVDPSALHVRTRQTRSTPPRYMRVLRGVRLRENPFATNLCLTSSLFVPFRDQPLPNIGRPLRATCAA